MSLSRTLLARLWSAHLNLYCSTFVADEIKSLEAEPHASVRANDTARRPSCFWQAEHAHNTRYLFTVSWPSAHRFIVFRFVALKLLPGCSQGRALKERPVEVDERLVVGTIHVGGDWAGVD